MNEFIEQIRKKKNRSKYNIQMEISGKFACFTRPDSGSEKSSYPVPTFSAVKGIFESVLYMPTVEVIPTRVEICQPIRYQSYAFNYRGEHRKDALKAKDATAIFRFSVLADVCYRVYACLCNSNVPEIEKFLSPKFEKYRKVHHAHSYFDQFNRRLKREQSIRRPHLGFADFICDYYGHFRPRTKVQENIDLFLESMLFFNFDKLTCGKINQKENCPIFVQKVKVIKGALNYVD